MSKDYLIKDEVVAAMMAFLDDLFNECSLPLDKLELAKRNAEEYINEIPLVDLIPVKRGEWQAARLQRGNDKYDIFHYWRCSNCGILHLQTCQPDNGKTDFCSDCGADMRKDTDYPW